MTLSIDNTDHTAKGEDDRIQVLTDAVNALSDQLAGNQNEDAIGSFGFTPSLTAIPGQGSAPLVSIGEISDDNPGDDHSSVSGGSIGAFFTGTSGDFGSISALELDVYKVGDGILGDMNGVDLFIANYGTDYASGGGTAASMRGFYVNCYNPGGNILGDVIGVDAGRVTNSNNGTIGGSVIGVRAQTPIGNGTTAGSATGVDVQSFAGVGAGDNHGVHIANHGTGAKDFALKTDGGRVCHDNTPVPASASAAGRQGEIAWDSGFIYVCVATNTWKRAAIATW